jgi:hypothetical protein
MGAYNVLSHAAFGNPSLTAVQLVPLLVERKTPPVDVPAKRFVPLTARHDTVVSVKPEWAGVQHVPLLVDRKTPPEVPAKRFALLTVRAKTQRLVKPVAVQLLPSFVDEKTPPPQVPAKRFVPFMAKLCILPP